MPLRCLWTKSNKRARGQFLCGVTWFYFCFDFVRSHARCGCCFIVCRRKFSWTAYMYRSLHETFKNKKHSKKRSSTKDLEVKMQKFWFFSLFSLVKVFFQFLEGRCSETYLICGFGRCDVSNENKRPIQYVF